MRPIDLNNLVPKAQLVSKVQQLQNNKQRFFVENQTTIQNKKFERELKKVNTTDKAYHTKINDKQKDNKNDNSHKNEEKHSQEKKDKGVNKNDMCVSDGTIGTKIDIKI
ncbi:MAG: hypothetical protein WDA24_03205 [Tissierellales bacterium]